MDILPATSGFAFRALRSAARDFADQVHNRAPIPVLHELLRNVRAAAVALDHAVPGSGVLEGGLFLPRHLAWAESILDKNKYPDQDAADMVGADLKHALQQIRQVTVEAPRTPSIRRALANLEGPSVEFKQDWPDQNRVLSHAIAAFGPQGGTLLIGVDNRGVPRGLPFQLADLDQKDLAVRGAAKAVDPPVRVSTTWLMVDDALLLDIEVHPSGEAIHYMDYVAWIRDGGSTRRARAVEVERLILEHHSGRPSLQVEASASSLIRDAEERIIGAFAHIRVTNVGLASVDVRGTVTFASATGESLHEEPMPIRWSGAPEPLSMIWTPGGPQALPDTHKIPLGHRIEIDVGDSEDAAIAVKFAGEEGAWGWNNKSYFHSGRHPAWPLPAGIVRARVVVRTGGREHVAHFQIDTSTPLERFATSYFAE